MATDTGNLLGTVVGAGLSLYMLDRLMRTPKERRRKTHHHHKKKLSRVI